jgi:nucleoside-diphosphate-sugar epimerase
LKYTVLGASGFIGSALVTHLQDLGCEVITPTREARPDSNLDLGHVIYTIGLTADFRTRPFDTIEAHIGVLSRWLSMGRFDSFVYLSSTRVYHGASRGQEDEPIAVSSQNPSDLYNLSKLAGESLCLNCGLANVKVARLANVVGEGAPENDFLPSLIKEARNGHIHLKTAMNSAKDYVHIADVVSLLTKIGPTGLHQLYNVASGGNTSHETILNILVQMTSCQVTVDPNAPVQCFPRIMIDRIKEEFGFTPESCVDYIPQLLSSPQ